MCGGKGVTGNIDYRRQLFFKGRIMVQKTSSLVSYIDFTDLDFRKEGRLLRFEFPFISYSASQFYRSCKIFHGKVALSKLKFNVLCYMSFFFCACVTVA